MLSKGEHYCSLMDRLTICKATAYQDTADTFLESDFHRIAPFRFAFSKLCKRGKVSNFIFFYRKLTYTSLIIYSHVPLISVSIYERLSFMIDCCYEMLHLRSKQNVTHSVSVTLQICNLRLPTQVLIKSSYTVSIPPRGPN